MGKLVNGINGPFVGKVGNIIGSSWRGIPYIKSRGLRTKPPTEGEKLNRFIFKKTQDWLYPLTHFLRVGFKGYTLKSQGVNAAKSYLHKNALIKDGYDTVIDPSLMKVSYGSLPLCDNMQVELKDDDKLVFTWDPTIKDGQHRDDQVMLLAYDIKNEVAAMTISGQFRHTGTDVLDVISVPIKTFVVYAAFVSVDRESQSDSVYLGAFTLKSADDKPERIIFKRKVAKKETVNESEMSNRSTETLSAKSEIKKEEEHNTKSADYVTKTEFTGVVDVDVETSNVNIEVPVKADDNVVTILSKNPKANTDILNLLINATDNDLLDISKKNSSERLVLKKERITYFKSKER